MRDVSGGVGGPLPTGRQVTPIKTVYSIYLSYTPYTPLLRPINHN